jgi:hypothetical protein
MYFGLTNGPATFQTMMNEIFQDLITEGVISVYLNDILIFTFDSISFTRADLATSWRSSRIVTPRFEGGVM